jgi:6,7-dimethyl-8-ribityllumazine synthase
VIRAKPLTNEIHRAEVIKGVANVSLENEPHPSTLGVVTAEPISKQAIDRAGAKLPETKGFDAAMTRGRSFVNLYRDILKLAL